MRQWIIALLDPEPIEKGNKDKHNTHIATPPRFEVAKAMPTSTILPPTSALRPTRSRTSRSASPSKIATPSRKIASPRKSRKTRSSAQPEATAPAVQTPESESAEKASSKLQEVMNGTQEPDSVASESVNGDAVRIEVQETVEQNGEVETTTTNVKVDLPADAPKMDLPDNPEDMIRKAKEMVEEANKLEGRANGVKVASKRKADELEVDEESEKSLDQPAKKVKKLEQQVKKEKVTARALIGLGAVAAIGFVLSPVLPRLMTLC